MLLESCILKNLFDEPFDCRQKFSAYAYGYNSAEKDLVMDRFIGLSIRQNALKKVENNWVQRLIEISDAVMFMHSRDV